MPVRKLNYTGRRRIKRADVRITLTSSVFSMELHRIDTYPAEARVFVEPYRQGQSHHVDFGTVGNFRNPPEEQRTLSNFRPPDSVLFRVKIVSPDDGKILAMGDRIRPEGGDSPDKFTKSTLVVTLVDLGEECWRVSFDDGDSPVLQIHERFSESGDWRQTVTSDYFKAFVYPAVLHQILCHVLLIEQTCDTEDGTYAPWLRFGRKMADGEGPPLCNDTDAVADWITSAVAGFAEKRTRSIREGIKTVEQ